MTPTLFDLDAYCPPPKPARYAVNLCDLSDLAEPAIGGFNPVSLLMSDYMDRWSPMVDIDTRFDSTAVILDGPAAGDPERVTALIDLLQTVLGPRKLRRRVRCYREGPRGGWSEIRADMPRRLDDDLDD